MKWLSLVVGWVCGTALWLSGAPLHADPIKPGDFGPDAVLLDFDALTPKGPLTFQLFMQGVRIQSSDGEPARVMRAEDLRGPRTQSPPNVVVSGVGGRGNPSLEFLFLSPRKKVGLFFGGFEGTARAQLRAYDERDNLIDETAVGVEASAGRDVDSFIGLGFNDEPRIYRATLDYVGLDVPKIIDDLIIEPGQDAVSLQPHAGVLRSTGATPQAKIAAINALQLHPSRGASALLQETALNDLDRAVRERAILALEQLRDPDAIPTLVEIGQHGLTQAEVRAAYNAVFRLRRLFPMADPPDIHITAVSRIVPGAELEVEATITSPVERDHVQIRFTNGKGLLSLKNDDWPLGYEGGTLSAGETVFVRRRFLIEEVGRTSVTLHVRVGLNRVDATTYSEPLYLDVQEDGGRASTEPPPGWGNVVEHVLTGSE